MWNGSVPNRLWPAVTERSSMFDILTGEDTCILVHAVRIDTTYQVYHYASLANGPSAYCWDAMADNRLDDIHGLGDDRDRACWCSDTHRI